MSEDMRAALKSATDRMGLFRDLSGEVSHEVPVDPDGSPMFAPSSPTFNLAPSDSGGPYAVPDGARFGAATGNCVAGSNGTPEEQAAWAAKEQADLAAQRELSGGFDTTSDADAMTEALGKDLEIDELMAEISTRRGGHLDLYKPGLAIDYYEHDDIASVLLTKCKASPIASPDEVCFTSPSFWGRDCIRRALLWTALVLRKGGAK